MNTLWVLVIVLTVTAPSFAQMPAGSVSAAPQVVGEAIPTTGGEVLQEAVSTEAELKRIEARFPASSELNALDDQLKALDKGLKERATRAEGHIESTARAQHRTDLTYRWRRARQTASTLVDDLEARSARMAEVRKRLGAIHTRWVTIRERALASDAPGEVTGRAQDTLAKIDAVRSGARKHESRILDQQLRATDALETIDRVLEAVARAEPSLANVLTRGLPLWRAPLRRADAAPAIETMRSDLALAQEFVEHARGGLVLQTLLFLILLVVISRLGRTQHHADEDAYVPLSAASTASAFLLVAVTVPLFHVATPAGVSLVVDLAATAAAFRLVPICLQPKARFAARLALAFVAVDIIRHATYPWPLPDRVGLALLMVLVVVLARVVFARYRDDIESPARWTRWALYGISALALAALIANVLGYVLAAELSANAAIRGSRLAVQAFITYRLALGFFSAAMDTEIAEHLAVVRDHRDLLLRRGRFILMTVTALAWGWVELELLAAREAATELWHAVMDHRFEIGSLQIGVSQLVLLVVGVLVSIGAARLTRFLLSNEVLPRLPLSPGGRHAASTTAGYSVLAIVFIAALASVGFELGQLAFLAGALGVGIGFGLQNMVNNFVSGLILLFGRPVEKGDTIVVGTVSGEVQRIGFRSSTLRTLEGAEVIVPNGELIANQVTNWTLTDAKRRIEVTVGVAYGSDVTRVRDVLLEAATKPAAALDDPPPNVLFAGFGDSSLDFRVQAWVLFADHVQARSDLCFAISEALERADIAIPFPQRDLHVRSVDPQAAAAISGKS